jgi:membrane protease YdiL (CAAX protease family)
MPCSITVSGSTGLAFGWLYWRRGLEAAILSHFVIDVIVHVIRPIAESWFA